ncbi:hypothetical protein Kim5_CH00822 [Rhizobium sp. Kim5]|uniref:hypothetical protein n=1 Tax=Rhizobium sp. Kim5 TaxID=2020311 RepID=UPI000A2A2AE3|nr:hypothetical protein [Rhizobium sp. Kim5]ARQ56929.1 hypothetical protein Kim5_CH00822 [Rhizobium sp. Kim5]
MTDFISFYLRQYFLILLRPTVFLITIIILKVAGIVRRHRWKNPMTRKEQSTWTMRKAWQLAKAGADRFGGKAREYLGEAIRQAWALYRETLAASRPPFTTFKDAVVKTIIVPVAEKLAEIAIAVVEFITPTVVLRARRFARRAMFPLHHPRSGRPGSCHGIHLQRTSPKRIACPTT